MKRGISLFFLITLLSTSFVFADTPKISGEWDGYFVAIYNTGDILALEHGTSTIIQNEQFPNLFYGSMVFSMGDFTITRLLTGYISEDKRISVNLTDEDGNPVGIIEGQLTGKTIKGVVRDFTDTTTTMFVATRK